MFYILFIEIVMVFWVASRVFKCNTLFKVSFFTYNGNLVNYYVNGRCFNFIERHFTVTFKQSLKMRICKFLQAIFTIELILTIELINCFSITSKRCLDRVNYLKMFLFKSLLEIKF